MKRLVALLILLSFSAAQLGSLLLSYGSPVVHAFFYGRVFKRHRVASDTRVFVLDAGTYSKALTDDREIDINDNRFDIIAVNSHDGQVTVHAVKDEYETNLLAVVHQLKEAVNKASQKKSTHKNVSPGFLKWHYEDKHPSSAPRLVYLAPFCTPFDIPVLLKGTHNLTAEPPDYDVVC